MTRRLKLKAMREAAATAKVFVESNIGKELRENVRFAESEVCKKLRDSATIDLDRLRTDVLAVSDVAKDALAGLTTDDTPDVPALRSRGKGGAPALYNWDGAQRHLEGWIKANGLPKGRKVLIGVAQDWFGAKVPNERDIRRLVARFYP
jgi:hypothetical protein